MDSWRRKGRCSRHAHSRDVRDRGEAADVDGGEASGKDVREPSLRAFGSYSSDKGILRWIALKLPPF